MEKIPHTSYQADASVHGEDPSCFLDRQTEKEEPIQEEEIVRPGDIQ